jgi:hypothetical protein
MDYVEIYSDKDGVSHFRDMSVEFTLSEVAPPALPFGASDFWTSTEMGFLSVPSGWVGGWHQPPADGFIIVLSGEAQVEVGDGEIRRFPPGSVWRHMDRNGPGHNSSVVSSEDVLLVIVKFPDEQPNPKN